MGTIAEFLLARIAEDEAEAQDIYRWLGLGADDFEKWEDRVLNECEAKRAIVAWHENWPVFVEKPPVMELDSPDAGWAEGVNTVAYRMTQELAFFTQQEYRKKFGDEPPTSPILGIMASAYDEHPDYDEAWRP